MIPCHQGSELRAVAKFHKGCKKRTSQKVGHPTFDVFVFRLAEQKPIPNAPDSCLFLSGEKRHEVGGSHEYGN